MKILSATEKISLPPGKGFPNHQVSKPDGRLLFSWARPITTSVLNRIFGWSTFYNGNFSAWQYGVKLWRLPPFRRHFPQSRRRTSFWNPASLPSSQTCASCTRWWMTFHASRGGGPHRSVDEVSFWHGVSLAYASYHPSLLLMFPTRGLYCRRLFSYDQIKQMIVCVCVTYA